MTAYQTQEAAERPSLRAAAATARQTAPSLDNLIEFKLMSQIFSTKQPF